jgi:hypothetical protein
MKCTICGKDCHEAFLNLGASCGAKASTECTH